MKRRVEKYEKWSESHESLTAIDMARRVAVLGRCRGKSVPMANPFAKLCGFADPN